MFFSPQTSASLSIRHGEVAERRRVILRRGARHWCLAVERRECLRQVRYRSASSAQSSAGRMYLRRVHTSNFFAILQELGISVLATTYWAGKLVMHHPDGERLNTHFRPFGKPMGLAVDRNRLAVGTTVEVWEYHSAPAVAGPSIERGSN